MDNKNKNGGESKNIQNLRAIIDRFSKGARKSTKNAKLVLGAALTATMLTSCTPIVEVKYNETTIENQEVQSSAPYSKTIGNGDYIFHNYIGEEPDIIASTAKTDVANYLNEGVTYLQNQFDAFNRSLADRPDLQRYFAQFNLDFTNLPTKHHHREITSNEKMDYIVNEISDVCTPVLNDIANSASSEAERQAFVLCYRVLANENYKEALGSARNNNAMMRKYHAEQTDIFALWSQNDFLKSVPLSKDITQDTFRYKRITSTMNTLLLKSIVNMRSSNRLLEDIKLRDLQAIINLSLNASSMTAMHDFTADLLKHENCHMNEQISELLHQNANSTTLENDLTF